MSLTVKENLDETITNYEDTKKVAEIVITTQKQEGQVINPDKELSNAEAEKVLKERIKDVNPSTDGHETIPSEHGSSLKSEEESKVLAGDFWTNRDIEIYSPRDEVILELQKPIEEIDKDKIYMTEGQFIYWVDRHLMQGTSGQFYSKFNPETLTVTIENNNLTQEDLEKVKQKVKLAFDHGAYGITNPNELTIKGD